MDEIQATRQRDLYVRESYYSRQEKSDLTSLDHRDPGRTIAKLIPSCVGKSIKLTKIPLYTSRDVIKDLVLKGCSVKHLPVAIYGPPRQRTRKLDNSDLIRGRQSLYRDVPHFKEIYAAVSEVTRTMRDICDKAPETHSEELEDLGKISTLRTGIYSHLGEIVSLPLQPITRAMTVALTAVVAQLCSHGTPIGFKEGILADFDTAYTGTGMPVRMKGEHTFEGRLLSVKAAPTCFEDPARFFDLMDRMIGQPLGLPPTAVYASTTGTRLGPTSKPSKLFFPVAGGFSASYEAESLYDRLRLIYPAAFVVNTLTSPVYMFVKSAFSRMVGCHHDDAGIQETTRKLQSQGKYSYAVDFSAMDLHISRYHVAFICDRLIAGGADKTSAQLLKESILRLSVLFPSFYNDSGTTMVSDHSAWPSGYKTTSIIDGIIGRAVLYALLLHFYPMKAKKWLSSSFISAHQGDDILITDNDKWDVDAMIKYAKEELHFTLKIIPNNAMFLKTIMPTRDGLKQPYRPISRFLQNTFFSEDDYDGKPHAINMIGMGSRLAGLRHNPHLKDIFPQLENAFSKLVWYQSLTRDQKNEISTKYTLTLTKQNEAEILSYASQNPTWLDSLVSRAQFERSSSEVLSYMEATLGRNFAQEQKSLGLLERKTLYAALIQTPSRDDIKKLIDARSWYGV